MDLRQRSPRQIQHVVLRRRGAQHQLQHHSRNLPPPMQSGRRPAGRRRQPLKCWCPGLGLSVYRLAFLCLRNSVGVRLKLRRNIFPRYELSLQLTSDGHSCQGEVRVGQQLFGAGQAGTSQFLADGVAHRRDEFDLQLSHRHVQFRGNARHGGSVASAVTNHFQSGLDVGVRRAMLAEPSKIVRSA